MTNSTKVAPLHLLGDDFISLSERILSILRLMLIDTPFLGLRRLSARPPLYNCLAEIAIDQIPSRDIV